MSESLLHKLYFGTVSYKVSESLLHKVSESLSNKLHSELQSLGLQTSQIVSYTRVVYSIISLLEALATRIDSSGGSSAAPPHTARNHRGTVTVQVVAHDIRAMIYLKENLLVFVGLQIVIVANIITCLLVFFEDLCNRWLEDKLKYGYRDLTVVFVL